MHSRPRLLLACCSLLLACTNGQGKTAAKPEDPCADFHVQVERYWSASVRAQALEHGGEIELEKRSGVITKLDRISEDWVMMRTSVCKDHFVRKLIDADEYAARVRCFDDRLDRQRSIATALTGDGSGAGSVDFVAGQLDALASQPASCELTPTTE